jgi:prepilin signal peptidase PulO-like enzyme (type II secretory pathway)
MIRKNSFPDIMTIMGFTVAALFLAFGLYILFSRQMANVPKEFRTIFGIIVISYGLFRSVIIYQKSRQRRNSDEESEF